MAVRKRDIFQLLLAFIEQPLRDVDKNHFKSKIAAYNLLAGTT